ncbi:MAG: hypothetical protein Q9159_003284 [Coniocarpon cinnabarinum]
MASVAAFKIPHVSNEPNRHYAKDSSDRQALQNVLHAQNENSPIESPIVVAGKEIHTKESSTQHNPSRHREVVARYSNATARDVHDAIDSAIAAKHDYESMPFADRAAIFLKAADLLSSKYRYELMALTMRGQGKNAWQAEIDAAAELCDFLSRVEYRALEGFVYAVTPFNFSAIAGNLPAAPALMGNVVIWKPSPSAVASNWLIYKIFLEAGLPRSVIQFLPGDAEEITEAVLGHSRFSALHYTGSTSVFRSLYSKIAMGVAESKYEGYPRIVGETGGKNFHVIHNSATVPNAAINTVRAAFEYQGQKCSACSRLYVPNSLWAGFRDELKAQTQKLKVGPPESFDNFVGPVIHEAAFKRLSSAIDAAKNDPDLTLLTGGTYDNSEGWFVQPTIYVTKNPHHDLMVRELFGPILCVYVYEDLQPSPKIAFESVCEMISRTTSYALTGAIFAQDRQVIRAAEEALRNAAGNFYANCKCTGAVVGQQPFGGARASGTNDKAGSANLLSRFVSMRAIKEQFVDDASVEYPSNEV